MATEQRTSSKEAQVVASERVRHRGAMTEYVARGLFVHSAPAHCCEISTWDSISGTIFFVATKLPLRTWCLGIYLVTQSKNGISALELVRLPIMRMAYEAQAVAGDEGAR